MKNIYNITKGQLITFNLCGASAIFILYVASINDEMDLLSGILGIIFLTFVIIFYTLGWRNNRNNK